MIYNEEQRELLDTWRRRYAELYPLLNEKPSPATGAEARRLVPLIVQLGRVGLEAEMNAAIITAWRLAPDDPYVLLFYGWHLLQRRPLEGEAILMRVVRSDAEEGRLRRVAQKWLDAYERSSVEPVWFAVVAQEITELGWLSSEEGAALVSNLRHTRSK